MKQKTRDFSETTCTNQVYLCVNTHSPNILFQHSNFSRGAPLLTHALVRYDNMLAAVPPPHRFRSPISGKQFVVLVTINIIIWMMVTSTKCADKNGAENNQNMTDSGNKTEENNPFNNEPIFNSASDLFGPVQKRPNKKLSRMATHLACPFEQETERKFRIFDVNSKNRIPLRKDKFLLNINPGDAFRPAQQIHAFRETILLAMYLNRSVVIPPFFKDIHDDSNKNNKHHKSYQDGQEIIQLNKLLKYVPAITLDELYEHCTSFGLAYNSGYLSWDELSDELDAVERFTGVHIFNPKTDQFFGKMVEPVDKNGFMDMNKNDISEYFYQHDDSAKCALFLSPFKTIDFETPLKTWAGEMAKDPGFGIELDSDTPLLASIALKATVRPKWVRPIVNKFLQDVGISRGYIFVSGDSEDLDGLAENKRSHSGVNEVYLPSWANRHDNSGFKTVVGTIELTDFLMNRYPDCPKERFIDEMSQVISIFEQEIAFLSNYFIADLTKAKLRAWNENIMHERQAWRDDKEDGYVTK